MNRREVIKNVALMLGGTFSAPTLMAMNHWEQATGPDAQGAAFSLSDTHRKIVAEVAEMIIPRTDTVGAKDAGVPAFIEMMLKDCYAQPEHMSFIEGLTSLEQVKFLELNEAERRGVLKYLEQQTKERMKDMPKVTPFWRLMKELTLLGYFTSEAGIKASFDYVQIPGKLENIKLKPGQKAYAY
ncbi:MAG: gluconate 2-dehydrogenase subunit 3 family protein [Spirosomataceae bacterium]